MPPLALKSKLVLIEETFAPAESEALPLRSAIGVWVGLSAAIWAGAYVVLAAVL